MLRRAVTFIAYKSIFRVKLVIPIHYIIPGNLGYDRRRGYRKAFSVAAYYAFGRDAYAEVYAAVYQNHIRPQ